jgi:glycosyltransferase involved in cell wall biosynthesis
MMATSVAVAIVTLDFDPDFSECLECTRTQTRSPDEIIVVSPNRASDLERQWPEVTFIRDDGNRSEARNCAWRHSESDAICFWEADSTFNSIWVQEVSDTLSRGPDAVIDRRKVHDPHGYFQDCWDRQFDIRYHDYTPFSAWAFRRDVLEDTAGYDERLTYAEDSDLGGRLLEKGYRIELADRAIQYHKGEPESFYSMLKRRFRFGYEKSRGFYRKHPDKYPRRKTVLLICTSAASVALFLIHPVILVLLSVFGYVGLAIGMAFRWNNVIDARYSPGIAAIRIAGGAAYHIGVIIGSISNSLRGDEWT